MNNTLNSKQGKDKLKLLKTSRPKYLEFSIWMANLIIWQRNDKLIVVENHKYKETESIKLVQSYLKSRVSNPVSILQINTILL